MDACFVSSDSDEILAEGKRWGAQGHKRGADASSDAASATEVVKAFLPSLAESISSSDPFLVYLQPTSPLRGAHHVDACLSMLHTEREPLAVSLSARPIHLAKTVAVDASGRVIPQTLEGAATGNRQDGHSLWAPNGAIYVFRVSLFLERGTFPITGAHVFWMDPVSSIDVDSEQDLALAEVLVRNMDAGILHS